MNFVMIPEQSQNTLRAFFDIDNPPLQPYTGFKDARSQLRDPKTNRGMSRLQVLGELHHGLLNKLLF